MSTLPTTLVDLDPNHTAGHNTTNGQVNTNSRPATVNTLTHSVAGALALDAEDGHIALVTVSANITSVTTPTNMVDGLPFLLILKGNGVSGFTADLTNIQLNSSTNLSATHAVTTDGLYHIAFVKEGVNLWAPGGVLDFANTGAVPGVSFVSQAEYNFTETYKTSHVLDLPSSYQSGDLLEAEIISQESVDPGAITIPAGWTLRWTNTPASSFRPRLTKVYKISNGSEGATLTITTPSMRGHGGSIAWRGVDNATPYDVAAPTEVQGSQNPDPAAITPVTANSLIVLYVAGNLPGGTPSTVSSGYTPVFDTDADAKSLVIATKELAVAAVEDPAAFTWNVGNSTARTEALRPA